MQENHSVSSDRSVNGPENLSEAPHTYGPAKCQQCGHQWTAVWPLGADSLECSQCHGTDTERDQQEIRCGRPAKRLCDGGEGCWCKHGSPSPLATWRAIILEAEGIVIRGEKFLLLDDEMTFRMGEALEMARDLELCTRSHPHENMDADCELLTEAAREQNAMRKVANDAAYWIVEVMRGTDQNTLYAQGVMEKARDHIQELVLLLHGTKGNQ